MSDFLILLKINYKVKLCFINTILSFKHNYSSAKKWSYFMLYANGENEYTDQIQLKTEIQNLPQDGFLVRQFIF